MGGQAGSTDGLAMKRSTGALLFKQFFYRPNMQRILPVFRNLHIGMISGFQRFNSFEQSVISCVSQHIPDLGQKESNE
jgi:hypothetical protein